MKLRYLLVAAVAALVVLVPLSGAHGSILPGSGPAAWWLALAVGLVVIGATLLVRRWARRRVAATPLRLGRGAHFAILALILLVGLLARTADLGQVPLGVYVDEALFGYDAYSLVETGRDHHGDFLPILFKGHDVLVNGVFFYCVAAVLLFLDPTVFAIRLAAGLLGLAAVFFTYKLVELYFSRSVGYVAAFLLAISPWHIHLSRIAMDPIALPTFFLAGFYLFSLGLRGDKDRYLILSAVPVGLSLHSYAVAKLFVPAFFLAVFVLNLKALRRRRAAVISWFAILVVMLLPFLGAELRESTSLNLRVNALLITSDWNPEYQPQAQRELEAMHLDALGRFKPTRSAYIFVRNYFQHVSADFLLLNGDRNLRHHVGGRGQLLWLTCVMMIVGLVSIARRRDRPLYIFPIWFLLFPVAASLTWDGLPHAGRSVCGLPVFEILAAVGLAELAGLAWTWLGDRGQRASWRRSGLPGIALCTLLLLGICKGGVDFNDYLRRYFGEFRVASGAMHDYDLTLVSRAREDLGSDLYLIDRHFLDISFLFLDRIDPRSWLAAKSEDDRLRLLPYLHTRDEARRHADARVAELVPAGSRNWQPTRATIVDPLTGAPVWNVKRLWRPRGQGAGR